MRHIDDSIAAHVAQSGGKVKAHHAGLLRAIAARLPDPRLDQPSVRISRAKLVALTGYTSEDTIKKYLGELVNLGCIRKSEDHNNEGTLITLLRPGTHDGIEPHPSEPTPDAVIAAIAVKWLRDGETDPMPLTADELQAVRVFDLIRRSGMLIRPKKGPKKRHKATKDEWSDIALAISDAVGIPRTSSGGPKKKYFANGRAKSWVAEAKAWKDANGEAVFARVLAAAKVWTGWGGKEPDKRAHLFEDPKLVAELLSAAPTPVAVLGVASVAEQPAGFVPTEEDHRICAMLRESLGLTEADALAATERIAERGLYEREVADAVARFQSNPSDRPEWLTD